MESFQKTMGQGGAELPLVYLAQHPIIMYQLGEINTFGSRKQLELADLISRGEGDHARQLVTTQLEASKKRMFLRV